MLFSSITNCISTFASNISVLCAIFHDSEFYFLNSLAFLKLVKIREFCAVLKLIIFAFVLPLHPAAQRHRTMTAWLLTSRPAEVRRLSNPLDFTHRLSNKHFLIWLFWDF